MGIAKQVKCRLNGGHDYSNITHMMTDGGMGKMFIHTCKCGSKKVKFV